MCDGDLKNNSLCVGCCLFRAAPPHHGVRHVRQVADVPSWPPHPPRYSALLVERRRRRRTGPQLVGPHPLRLLHRQGHGVPRLQRGEWHNANVFHAIFSSPVILTYLSKFSKPRFYFFYIGLDFFNPAMVQSLNHSYLLFEPRAYHSEKLINSGCLKLSTLLFWFLAHHNINN